MTLRIVVLGGGIAGLMAASAAKRACVDSEVTIFDDEPLAYKRPALTSIIMGVIRSPREISIFPPSYLSSLGIKIRNGVRAIEMDAKDNLVKYCDSRGLTKTVSYDRLILATGGYAVKPMLKGADKPGVFTLRTFQDALNISEWAKKASSATVVGAGFVGLLAAEALVKRGLKVNLIARSRLLRVSLEADLARLVQSNLERYGVKVFTGTSIEEIGGNDQVKWVETSAGKIHSDLVLFAIGVKPRVELAEAAGIEIEGSGIAVNERMQTSIENVYAAGDCIDVMDAITKRKTYLPIGSLAAAEGQIAGSNSAGETIESEGFLRAQDEEIFHLHIVSIGCTTERAVEANLRAEVLNATLPSSRLLGRFEGPQVKLVVNAKDDLIGAQMIASKDDLYANSYSLRLLNFVKERRNLSEVLENLKMPTEPFPSLLS
ncbi:MAG: NAD(P)/FAD-dependent oxidoreductase [Candidatus Bathyarchaeia archaeon]